jgi:hypothetical protein
MLITQREMKNSLREKQIKQKNFQIEAHCIKKKWAGRRCTCVSFQKSANKEDASSKFTAADRFCLNTIRYELPSFF